jgi:hypothetical protein
MQVQGRLEKSEDLRLASLFVNRFGKTTKRLAITSMKEPSPAKHKRF